MEYEKIRYYEVSVWTLQDEFITVLKQSDLENKGQIQDGHVTLKDDGTQELEFNIPMYLEPGVENPIWYTVKNGILITNMRKIKVIFNKNTEDERVFEFLITNVEESHENDELYCNVKCEGLAFHELGKRGFKLALSEDDYWMDDNVVAWYDGDEQYQQTHDEPVANIQYWLNKFMEPLPENTADINPYKWYYELNMDWSSYPVQDLDASKIYDQEYATGWTIENNKLIASSVQPPREKARLVNISDSNYYNATQELAEVFGVFCRYEYGHDENYHITYRKVVFYNNFYSEKNGYLDFTYPHSAEQITRTNDSTDLVTKLYVRNVEDENAPSGVITILDADANPSGEDYILNFDYLHDVKTISDEQYEQVGVFEAEMHRLNSLITPIDKELTILYNKVPELEGKITLAENAAQLDRERIEDTSALFNALTDNEGADNDGYIMITENNPRYGTMVQDSSSDDPTKCVYRIPDKGVIVSSFHLYRKFNAVRRIPSDEIQTSSEYQDVPPVQDEIVGNFEYDEYGNATRVVDLYCDEDGSKLVWAVYNYRPRLYYENIKRVWERRLAKDERELEELQQELEDVNDRIAELETEREDYIEEKEKEIRLFEEEMGPALREGYWDPEDYTDYSNSFIDSIDINISPIGGEITGKTPYAKFIWDTEPFTEEQLGYYELGVDQTKHYFPCIKLNNNTINAVKDHLDELSFLFWDFQEVEGVKDYDDNRLMSLPLGSQCQLAFVYSDTNNYPVILITGEKAMKENDVAFMKQNGFLGKLTTEIVDGRVSITAESYVDHADIEWLELGINTPVSYPRIEINSLFFKHSTDELRVFYNSEKLEDYADYSVLNRDDKFYITIKPEVLIKHGEVTKVLRFMYSLSTAATAIYLDALEVSRENAYPKVSYTIDPNVYGRDFMHTAYNMLGALIHINDVELKFDGVRGYISELNLDLDMPWQDEISVVDYKNKFEDIFATIVAQADAMKASAPVISAASQILNVDGTLQQQALQETLRTVDLDYAFNNGALTISEDDGIWGTSDNGVVALRGGGIFTATQKDEDGSWIWNTGITPEGINADLITTGQLDTNRIKIYAGDRVKFQLNGNGIYAYRSLIDDLNSSYEEEGTIYTVTDEVRAQIQQWMDNNSEAGISEEVDSKQYIRLYDNGLFLIAKDGALILNEHKDGFVGPLTQDVRRVEISWDGLKLRNWNNEVVFEADPDTGNLKITGQITANSGEIGGWTIGQNDLHGPHIQLVSNNYIDIDGQEQLAGIYLYNEENVEPASIIVDNDRYYIYTVDGNAEGTQYYYKTESTNPPESLTSLDFDYLYWYPDEVIGYKPIELISEEETTTEQVPIYDPTTGEITGYETQTVTYIVQYLGDGEGNKITNSTTGEYIVYDDDTSSTASWYTQLTQQQKDDYVEKIIETSDTLTLIDADKRSELQGETIKYRKYQPTFKAIAETGEVDINAGTIANFIISQDSLSAGTLKGVTIPSGTIDGVAIENNFRNAFINGSINNNTGVMTFTRINGTTVNFNISGTKFFKDREKAAGGIKSVTGTGNKSGKSVQAKAVSKYGTTGYGWIDASSVYNDGKNSVDVDNIYVDDYMYSNGNHSFRLDIELSNDSHSYKTLAYYDTTAYDAGVIAGGRAEAAKYTAIEAYPTGSTNYYRSRTASYYEYDEGVYRLVELHLIDTSHTIRVNDTKGTYYKKAT